MAAYTLSEWPKLDSLDGDTLPDWVMTTKTIPTYLQDERRKGRDAELRIAEEAARIQPLHHGYHRTAKPQKLELPSPLEPQPKGRQLPQQLGKSSSARKTATKIRKMA
jgi:hypothetical protein